MNVCIYTCTRIMYVYVYKYVFIYTRISKRQTSEKSRRRSLARERRQRRREGCAADSVTMKNVRYIYNNFNNVYKHDTQRRMRATKVYVHIE